MPDFLVGVTIYYTVNVEAMDEDEAEHQVRLIEFADLRDFDPYPDFEYKVYKLDANGEVIQED